MVVINMIFPVLAVTFALANARYECIYASDGVEYVSNPIEFGFTLQFGACKYRHFRVTSNGYITLGMDVYFRSVPNFFESQIPVIAPYGANISNSYICLKTDGNFYNFKTTQEATAGHFNDLENVVKLEFNNCKPSSDSKATLNVAMEILADKDEAQLIIYPPMPIRSQHSNIENWPGSAERSVIAGYSFGIRDNPGMKPYIFAASPLYAQDMANSGYSANFSAYAHIVKDFSYYYKRGDAVQPDNSKVPAICNAPDFPDTINSVTSGTLLPYANKKYQSIGASGFYLPAGLYSRSVINIGEFRFGACKYSFLEINSNGYLSMLNNENFEVKLDFSGTMSMLSDFKESYQPIIAPFASFMSPIGDGLFADSFVFVSRHLSNDSINSLIADRIRSNQRREKFEPNNTVIVTYHKIKLIDQSVSLTSQVAVTTDGVQTFLLFNYALSESSNQTWDSDAPILIGFSYGKSHLPSRNVTLLYQKSNNIDETFLPTTSYDLARGNILGNTGQIGRWLYKIEDGSSCSPISAITKMKSNLLPHGYQLRKLQAANEKCTTGYYKTQILNNFNTSIPFGARRYRSAIIDNLGIIAFVGSNNQTNDRISTTSILRNKRIPIVQPLLSGDFSNLIPQVCIAIHYNETSANVINAIADLVKNVSSIPFKPNFVLIVTVTMYESSTFLKALTFQTTVATDGRDTRLIFAYSPGELNMTNYRNSYSTFGFDGYAIGYTYDRSLSSPLLRLYEAESHNAPYNLNMYNTSNTDFAGLWYYQIETSLPGENLFPYGNATENANYLPSGFNTSKLFKIPPIKFGGCYYDYALVSSFGYIKLLQHISDSKANAADYATTDLNYLFNDVNPIIAPFAAYTAAISNDSTSHSYVVYSLHVAADQMNAIIAKRLLQYHNDSSDFKFLPKVSMVVTFNRLMPAFGDVDGISTITAQAVLASDGADTYVLFNYDGYEYNDTIWTGLQGQVGYSFGDVLEPISSKILTYPSTIVDAGSKGNTGKLGRWYFKTESAASCQRISQQSLMGLLPSPQSSYASFARSNCLPSGNVNYVSVDLNYNLSFGGCVYRLAFISTKGFIVLANSLFEGIYNENLPLLAPFHSDLRSISSRTVCYSLHYESDSYLYYIRSRLSPSNAINIKFALVVTYNQISTYGSNPQSTTFQAAVFTDGQQTSLFYNYDTDNSNWNTALKSVTVGYRYDTALDPTGNFSTLVSYPTPLESTGSLNFGKSSNIGRLGVYFFKLKDFRVNNSAIICLPITSTSTSAARTTTRPATSPPPSTISPLEICTIISNSSKTAPLKNATSCRCNNPYFWNGSVCLGASPAVVMFPSSSSRVCSSRSSSLQTPHVSIKFGGQSYSFFRVTSQGYITLESSSGFISSYVPSWSYLQHSSYASPAIAPYGADLAFYSDVSSVCYSIHYSSKPDSIIDRANQLIQNYTSDQTFSAQTVVVVTYDKMARSGFKSNISFPREAVTAQAVIIIGDNLASKTYVNFNYQFADYVQYKPWNDSLSTGNTSSQYSSVPEAGFDFRVANSRNAVRKTEISASKAAQFVRAKNSSVFNANAFDQIVGNTGLLGSWLFQVDRSYIINPVVRHAKNPAPQSFDELEIIDPTSVVESTILNSPLASCKKTTAGNFTDCVCRSPYVASGKVCRGASPSVVMFKFGGTSNSTCLSKIPAIIGNSVLFSGIYFGGSYYSYLRVAGNGFLLLETTAYEETKRGFKWKDLTFELPESAAIAAYGYDMEFYSDVSNVCYNVYYRNKTFDLPTIERANQLVKNYTADSAFSADLVIVVTYEKLAPSNYASRLATPREAVTAQAVIISNAEQRKTYVNFNYEFVDYLRFQPFIETGSENVDFVNFPDWQQAAFDFAGLSGTSSKDREVQIDKWKTISLVRNGNSSIVNANAFDQLLGNTGLLGSWLFRVDGVTVIDPVVRRAKNPAPQSFNELKIPISTENSTTLQSVGQSNESPLTICQFENTTKLTKNCTCRKPFIRLNNICKGTNPDVVMFSALLPGKNCVPHTTKFVSQVEKVRSTKIGGRTYDYFAVAPFGYLILSNTYNLPKLSQQWNSLTLTDPVIAPYAGNLDFSENSSVCYCLHESGSGYRPVIDRASQLVRNYTADSKFSARSVIVVDFNKMVPRGSDYSLSVTVPETVTAQAIIIAGGSGSDRSRTYVNFNYEFNDYVKSKPFSSERDKFEYSWEQAFLFPKLYSSYSYTGSTSSVRYTQVSSENNLPFVLAGNSSIVNANAFDQLVGNTGILGSWLYRVDSPSVLDPVVRRSSNPAPQSTDEINFISVSSVEADVTQARATVSPTVPLPSALESPSKRLLCSKETIMYGRVALRSGKIIAVDPVDVLLSQLKLYYNYTFTAADSELQVNSVTVESLRNETFPEFDLKISIKADISCENSDSLKQKVKSLKSNELLETMVNFVLTSSGCSIDTEKTKFLENCWPTRRASITSRCSSQSIEWWTAKLNEGYIKSGLTELAVRVLSVSSTKELTSVEYEISSTKCDNQILVDRLTVDCELYLDTTTLQALPVRQPLADGAVTSSSSSSPSTLMVVVSAIALVAASVGLTLVGFFIASKVKKRRHVRSNRKSEDFELKKRNGHKTIPSEIQKEALNSLLLTENTVNELK